MTRREVAKPDTVLILGSGPVVIGQAAEFDYAGTQACRALKGEGVRTILVNSNPATIMTDPQVADVVYLEPLTVEAVEAVIARERPDGILAGLGGQTALNLATALADRGVFERYDVRLLGTPLEAIRMAEDREAFRDLLDLIGQPYAPSAIVEGETTAAKDASRDAALREIGLPAIVRPACRPPESGERGGQRALGRYRDTSADTAMRRETAHPSAPNLRETPRASSSSHSSARASHLLSAHPWLGTSKRRTQR